MSVTDDAVVVATDGACKPNPGAGGWAWVASPESWEMGSLGRSTNNVAELEAVRRALLAVPPMRALTIQTDSMYVVNCLTKWAPAWQRNGWRTKDGQQVSNRGLLDEVLSLLDARYARVEFEHVAGHAGHLLNEVADRRAVQARVAYPDRVMVGGPGWNE